jgi:hypothetical protein
MVERMGKFKALMEDRRNTVLARQAVRKLLNVPMLCTPVVKPDGRRGNRHPGGNQARAMLSSPASVTLVPRKGLEPPQCCHR